MTQSARTNTFANANSVIKPVAVKRVRARSNILSVRLQCGLNGGCWHRFVARTTPRRRQTTPSGKSSANPNHTNNPDTISVMGPNGHRINVLFTVVRAPDRRTPIYLASQFGSSGRTHTHTHGRICHNTIHIDYAPVSFDTHK